MSSRIATELKPLVKLANEQGWAVAGNDNGKLVWRGPNGEGPVYTGYRCNGRDLQNYRAQLVRAGLKLDEDQAKKHVEQTQVAEILDASDQPVDLEKVKEAMNVITTSMAIMHVKASEFDAYRNEAKEWEKIATEATEALNERNKELERLNGVIGAIADCFQMAPWAILPEIAKLLGIDANGPMGQPSPVQAATSTRKVG